MNRWILPFAAIAFVLLAGCGGPTQQAPTGAVISVAVSPDAVSLAVEETETLVATVRTSGNVDDGVTWSSSDAGIVTVDSEGTVTAVAEGTATVTATSVVDDGVEGSASVTVSGQSGLEVVIDTATSDGTTVVLPFRGATDVVVHWGDGSHEVFASAGDATHTYETDGTYRITVEGALEQFGNGADGYASSEVLVEVTSWGTLGLSSLSGAFAGAVNLTAVPSVLPSTVAELDHAFDGADSFAQSLDTWDVTSVTTMRGTFSGASAFTGDLATWNVANVADMSEMFHGAAAFNGAIGGWNVSSVVAMDSMFEDASAFDQDLSRWCVAEIVTPPERFDAGATAWDGPRPEWGTCPGSAPMIVVIDTTYTDGRTVTLPLQGWTVPVDVSVDWGDGTTETFQGEDVEVRHVYAADGRYEINITGSVGAFGRAGGYDDAEAIVEVLAWGDLGLASLEGAFDGATNLTRVPDELPATVRSIAAAFSGATSFQQDLSGWDTGSVEDMSGTFSGSVYNQDLQAWDTGAVTSMAAMFAGNTAFDRPIGGWDTSSVRSMQGMFSGATSFDQDIGDWDVSNVETMRLMFRWATSFDRPLDRWDVSNVGDMNGMFEGATAFDSAIGTWNVSNVRTMQRMFLGAAAFNQPIGAWDVSNVEDMSRMFFGIPDPLSFNQPLGAWDVGNVTDMSSMFSNAVAFDQALDAWDVANVTTMNAMFAGATTFNQDLASWNVARVEDMSYMFHDATSFNGEIGAWNVSGVQSMSRMFSGASTFDRPLSNWDVSNVTDMGMMFSSAEAFDRPIGSWDVSAVTDMASMFRQAVRFDQPIGTWDTSSVTSMRGMFSGATAFDQDLSGWSTGLVEDMAFLFYEAAAFNGNVSSWDTSRVATMNQTFYEAVSFNQPIGAWNTSNVTHMGGMLSGAVSFNQPIGAWDTSSVTDMRMMFYAARSFNQPIGAWDTGGVTDMSFMFYKAQSFDQSLAAWDTSNVASMAQMFQGAVAFNGDIGAWQTGAATTMYAMFNAASAFDRDIGGWNTRNVYDMNYMFDGASSFNHDLSGWCVEQLPWKPTSFDNGALSWSLPRPAWGTCPGTTSGVEVTLTPRDVTLTTGERTSFTASVSESSDLGVAWSATCGDFTGGGTEVTYVAPASAGACIVTATSVASPSEWADATVTVPDAAVYQPGILWTRQFGTGGRDEARGVAVDAPSGRIYVVGSTTGSLANAGSALEDVFVRAIDSDGTALWTRQFGSSGQDFGWDVAVAPDGTVVVAARLNGAGVVRKFEDDGSDAWTHTITDMSDAYDVSVDPTGHILVSGSTRGSLASPNAGEEDAFVRKLDADGAEVWTRQYGDAGWDVALDVAVDAQGNVAVVGSTEISDYGETNVLVWMMDADGNELWDRSFGSGDPAEGTAVAMDPDGDVLVAGAAIGSVGGDAPGDYDPFVRRYDPDGTVEWTHQFGTPGYEHLWGIAVGGDGRIAVVGLTDGALTETATGTRDAFVATVASNGTPLEIYQFGTTGADIVQSVDVDASGHLVVVGSTQGALGGTNLGSDDVFVRKLDP